MDACGWGDVGDVGDVGGKGGGIEHERSRQEKEARVGWVKRQAQIGVVV